MYSSILVLILVLNYGEALERASGVAYIGRGYDIVTGNPDGVPLGGTPPASSSDPGIKSINWLKLTYEQSLTDIEGRTMIPDQLSYQSENSCLDMKSSSVITTDKQYQEKLSSSVSLGGSTGFGFAKVAFSTSMSYSTDSVQNIKSKKVYFEENHLCSYGNAIYRFGNKDEFLRLTDDSMRLVCRLPSYMSNQYYELISHMGTHFIYEAILGTKRVNRKETVMTSFFESVLQTSGVNSGVSASYMGTEGSLGVKVDSSSLGKNSENVFGSEEVTWTMGTREYNNPTQIKLKPITELLDKKNGFWTVACSEEQTRWGECCTRLDTIKSVMEGALGTYASVYQRVEPPTSQPLTFELVWPEGTYALPSVRNRCPRGHSFAWAKGTVFQDTDDWADDNKWSSGINWQSYQLDTSSITQLFCVKGINNANDYELKWPRGDYCVNRYMKCPSGFKEGTIKFDDENVYNKNWNTGSVPDGVYESDTTLYYCCRSDGSPLEPIRLPSTDEFYLVRRGNQCQEVHNTVLHAEWVEWSLESWWGLDESEMLGGESQPYTIIRDGKLRMFFCHYTPITISEKETVTINIQ